MSKTNDTNETQTACVKALHELATEIMSGRIVIESFSNNVETRAIDYGSAGVVVYEKTGNESITINFMRVKK